MDKKLLVGIALVALLAGASAFYGGALKEKPFNKGFEGKGFGGFGAFAELTEEQRTELQGVMQSTMESMKARMAELKDSGATKEEIMAEMAAMREANHLAMQELFAGYGIELPEMPERPEMPEGTFMGKGFRGGFGMGKGHGMGLHGFDRANLTEDQKAQLGQLRSDCSARMKEVIGEPEE